MERLTKREQFGEMFPEECGTVIYIDENKDEYASIEMVSSDTQRCLDKLADYEDLDERGMVIRDGEPVKCFANITFDKDDFQKMVDEKVSEIELNIDKIKEETIDEFVKMLREYSFISRYGTLIILKPSHLDEIVANMKAGEE